MAEAEAEAGGGRGPSLELRQGDRLVARYPLTPGQSLVVGRERDLPIHVDDPAVSRRHAEIFVLSTPRRNVLICDLDSTNGLHLRGQRVRRAFLEYGDRIALGGHELVLVGPEGPPGP